MQPPPQELILDNGDPGTTSSGNWQTKTNAQQYGTNYEYANQASGRSYRWTATPPGTPYDVYAWWVDGNRWSDTVSYTIRYGSGATDNVLKSHGAGGGQWQYLGTYSSIDGQDYVEVSSSSNKFSADAVRWVHTPAPVVTVSEGTFFVHTDQLGTPRRVSDDQQTVVWRWDSSPFGDAVADEDPDADLNAFTLNLRFPGQYFDGESGLNYNYFRDYDSATGRYIESDPIGLFGSTNPYGYSANSPMGNSDPAGLYVNVVAWGATRLIGGRAAGAAIGNALRSSLGPAAGTLIGCVLVGACSIPENPDDIDDVIGASDAPPYPGIEDLSRDCKPSGERIVEEAQNPRFKGGISIEQGYECTCGFVTRHTIIKEGKIVHDHFRPGRPKGNGGFD